MKKNNWLIITLIGVLSVTLIGISYAYFHARILGNDKALKNKVQAGTLELSFVDDNSISIPNGKPGSKASKTFSVTNTSTLDEDFTYNIKLVMTELTFVKRDLKYTLEEYPDATFQTPKENGIKEEGYINTDSVNEKNEMYLAVDIPRPAKGATHYYKLTVDFQELNIRQDYNQEAIFRGKVNVDDEKNMKIYEQAPNVPELYQGMIPVTFDTDGNVYVADVNSDWYNYDDNKWANAVLVDNSKDGVTAKYFDGTKLKEGISGNQIPMDEILQMYVWIPRYRYKLFNANNQSVEKQLIDIEFEKDIETTGNVSCTYTDMKNGTVLEDCKNAENGNWYTHPAFTFGNTQLKGFWVGKFEPSDPTDPNGRTINSISEISILPDKTSMTYKNITTIFTAERNIELQKADKYNLNATEIDTHMARNTEWGAIAYLTQSVYGIYKDENTCNIAGMTKDNCEVWINNTAQGTGTSGTWMCGGTYTGCVGESVSAGAKWNTQENAVAKCDVDKRWNTVNGVKASTTGNMYGIYDTVGGTYEYVMAATVNQINGGLYVTNASGFQTGTLPESKYYDMYTFDDSNLSHSRGHLGDAIRETLADFGKTPGGWNGDNTNFPSVASEGTWPWFRRGGGYDDGVLAGLFTIAPAGGEPSCYHSFRSILSAA